MKDNPHLFCVGDVVQPKQIPVIALWRDPKKEGSRITETKVLTVKVIGKVRFADTLVFEEIGGVFDADHFTKV